MLRTIVFTTIIGIVFFAAEFYKLGLRLPLEKWYLLSFFFFLSFLQHRLVALGLRENRERFVQFFLAAVVIRLILCVLLVAGFIYKGVAEPAAFIITFFVLYLFYTFFEVLGLYRNLRPD